MKIIDIREWFWHLFFSSSRNLLSKILHQLAADVFAVACLFGCQVPQLPRSIKNAPLCYSWQLLQFAFAATKTAQLATLSFYHQVMI